MAEKWMQKAFGANPGALHRQLGVPEGSKIPPKKLSAALKKARKSGDTKTLRRLSAAKTGAKIARSHSKRTASGQDCNILGHAALTGGHAGHGRSI